MAKTKDAIAAIAAVMGLHHGTATVADRALVDAGRRPLQPRGRGQHDVEPAQVATLIVALAAAEKVKETLKAVDDNRTAVASVQDAIEAEAASPGIARKSNWSLTIDLPSAGDLKRRSTISWKTIEAAAGLLAKEMGR